jgi:UDP-N-acetylmuramoylalanine--D-glutamate ligase
MGEGAAQDVLWFSLRQEVSQGAFLRGEQLVVRLPGREESLCPLEALQMLGQHNVANTLAACALAGAVAAPVEAMRQVATQFSGIAHRLELVRERNRVRWYNDSIATAPERTVAALKAFSAPIILLAGGRDKHLPWNEMADLTWRKVRNLILFGESAPLIEAAMLSSRASFSGECQMQHAGTLAQAVQAAAQVAQPGDVVLLSPGGTSFDSYEDYEERGRHFRELVQELE